MKKLILLPLCLLQLLAFSQAKFSSFQWKPAAALHQVDASYKDAAAVYIADQRIVEFAFDKNELYIYRTVHRIVHINNDKGIESFNKIYLPFNEGIEMVDVKARTILSDGKVIELNKSNIKDLKDEDGEYKIFALEGLTKGCEIEYYYTIKKYPSFFGREVLGTSIPVQEARFELVTPDHLVFETKSYNNLPIARDTSYGDKRYLLIRDKKINELEEEKYSMHQANLKRVEYKLCYNSSRNAKERLFTWNELAKKAYEIYSSVGDKDMKKLKDVAEDLKLETLTSETAKISAIEAWIKKTFTTRDDIDDADAEDLGKVMKAKVASHRAINRLFTGLFTIAGINFQIVLCGNRTDFTIDQKFENWNSTRNLVFFFPGTGKFLAPTEMEYRYPWIPPTWAGSNGLYCESTTIGSFTTAMGEVKNIPLENYEHNYSNIEVSIKMDKDDALLMDLKQIYGGYYATNYRAIYNFLPAEEQKNVLKEMVKYGTNSENILSSSFDNRELDQKDPYKPFVINASVKSPNLVERAGDKIMIKIGEVIGEQAELYDAKPRSTPIELQYPHALRRVIKLTIPEGYRVKNLTDLNFNISYKEGGKATLAFVSGYEQKGNEVTIKIDEEYLKQNYPMSIYDDFKKVINAAADFNKVVLILEKI